MSNKDTLLCSICANLDFYKIFLDGIPETEEIPLDTLSSILKKSYQCSFCRLIAFHVRRTWMLDNFPHFDLSRIECRILSQNCGHLRGYPLPKFRCYRLHINMEGLQYLWERYPASRAVAGSLRIHLMQEDAFKFGRPIDVHGRRLKDVVDINLVKNWINICQENHGDDCRSARSMDDVDRKLPEFVRVVDVVSMSVIPAPSRCRYVALSYVWGDIGAEYWTAKDNVVERSKPGGLNAAHLPETITDSILFVRQLGERYIWIDALCIIQDDSQDKFAQIQIMDLVYGLSYLTIVTASGKTRTARDPLPGCRPRTRTSQQHIEVVQGLHLYVGPPRLREALAMSAWNTRCWTYQESVLSHRRIYFTGQQVYFECRRDVFCEDIIAENQRFIVGGFLQSSGDGVLHSHSFANYLFAVKECTRRNLTVESDVVDAITGVTNALAIAFGLGDPTRVFQYGMMLTDLHHTLLWQHDPHTPRSRRSLPDRDSSPRPSWAWATWRGAIDYLTIFRYEGITMNTSPPEVVETFVDPWYIVDHSGDIVQFDVPRKHQVIYPRMPKTSYSPPHGVLDTTELTLNIHRPLEPSTLIFRTTSSHFGIARRARLSEESSTAPIHHGLFDILSTTSSPTVSSTSASSPPEAWVGTAVLPLDHALPTSLEFIVLSRTDIRGVYDEESFPFYLECSLHVMAISSQNEGLMERVGLGIIHEAAWIASNAKEKVVFLR
ncbi:heterokaryon incompatibility protein-domain-containing protein [Suillus clintonianus]|uniref:heterokaryon incompatibility protein-domain-containing protein n=1 Tax=Suillus clintonianus TaxID=1904413 RepID=UPI001B861746|nr:heterokaryon incompatibility protein-domain-containing protein [Suillus clintonianus]KAG2145859.1 heterokaryon incompatibility protein-domain-containing protein [Suillus clintonianus]